MNNFTWQVTVFKKKKKKNIWVETQKESLTGKSPVDNPGDQLKKYRGYLSRQVVFRFDKIRGFW